MMQDLLGHATWQNVDKPKYMNERNGCVNFLINFKAMKLSYSKFKENAYCFV